MTSKRNPEVSVIIIFLNARLFLSSAIESVLAQTFRDWELLLVDDGSSDGSTEIAKKFAVDRPDLIRFYEHSGHANLGMSAARNLGLLQALGNFIAFLDADDLWPADKLERQVAVLRNREDVDIVLGKILFLYAEDTAMSRNLHPLEFPPDEIIDSEQLYRRIFLHPKGMLTTFGRLLVRRTVLVEIDGFEDKFRGLGEDVVCWGKIALSSKAIAINDCALLYRRHSDASGYKDKDLSIIVEGMIQVLSFLIDYISKKPVQTQNWALPILRESLFKHYVRKAWVYPKTPSKLLHFVDRRKQLLQMLLWMRRETELLTPWRFLQIIIRLFVGEKMANWIGLL